MLAALEDTTGQGGPLLRLATSADGSLDPRFQRLGLSLAGVDDQWRVFATGILVIVAVGIDQWIRKVKA